jgi:hypothetical protein
MRKVIPYDRTGNKNPKWRGGRIKRPDGRVCVYAPGHPGAILYGGNHILEYRLIAEQITGRPLFNNEIVHHKNGDITDNSLENLEVITQSEHAKKHFSGELSPNHKLTTQQVVFIRTSELTLIKLSKLFGVSITTVNRAKRNITYKLEV